MVSTEYRYETKRVELIRVTRALARKKQLKLPFSILAIT